MINNPEVTILMATYNGAQYIKQQLDSLINQTYTNWKLIIRDDGSTDNTIEIVEQYISLHSNVSLVINKTKQKGAVSNFAALYALARKQQSGSYIMFCDQDDIWLPNKIKATMALMQNAEQQNHNKPVMIFGNMQMITSEGVPIDEEMKLMPQLSFNRTLVQNYALGCTMMINNELIQIMEDIPLLAENHDYWVCLIATAFGVTRYLEDSYLQYRQHNNNVTSQGAGMKKRFTRFTSGFNKQIETFKKRMLMLQQFFDIYQLTLKSDQRDMLLNYLDSYGKGRLHLIFAIRKYKIYKLGLLQNLGLLYTIFFFYTNITSDANNKQMV